MLLWILLPLMLVAPTPPATLWKVGDCIQWDTRRGYERLTPEQRKVVEGPVMRIARVQDIYGRRSYFVEIWSNYDGKGFRWIGPGPYPMPQDENPRFRVVPCP